MQSTSTGGLFCVRAERNFLTPISHFPDECSNDFLEAISNPYSRLDLSTIS